MSIFLRSAGKERMVYIALPINGDQHPGESQQGDRFRGADEAQPAGDQNRLVLPPSCSVRILFGMPAGGLDVS